MRRLCLFAVLPLLALATPAHAAPEHAEIAFVRDGAIWASRADGSDARVLVAGDNLAEPAWSPDGSRLAYVSGTDDSSRLLVDGRPLTPLRKDVLDHAPAWSPDGTALAFARYHARNERFRTSIVVRDLASGAERVLVTQRLFPRFDAVSEPAWAPDGATILYTHSRMDGEANLRPEIRRIPAAGGASTRLIRDAQSPAWAPDGARLAFASVRDRNGIDCSSDECWFAGEIYTAAAADGGDLRRLTRNEGDDARPRWSPDGTRILFTSDRNLPGGATAEVYSVAADGTCLTWLTNGWPASASATWRPGTGSRYDPGSCDPATRPPQADPPAPPSRRGSLWLGTTYRGLLLTGTSRAGTTYDDCASFDPRECPSTIALRSEPACRPATFRGLGEGGQRFLRVHGALVAYYSPAAVVRVLSGRTVTSIELGSGGRLADVLPIVRRLRPATSAAPSRLTPPRIPRALKLTPGPFRRALRSFGPLRYSRCR